MTCPVCGDKGILKVGYQDGTPHDYAVCLCRASVWYRSDRNNGKVTGSPGWRVWAAREQVDPERVYGLEDLYEPSELTAMGFATGPQDVSETSREAALLAAGKTRKGKP